MDLEQKFVNRLFMYRLQHVASLALTIICWWLILDAIDLFCPKNNGFVGFFGIPLIFSLYNTFTYFWSSYLAKKYGVEIFGDLDQKWLKESREFDSKDFDEKFLKLIQCRKIAGLYTNYD